MVRSLRLSLPIVVAACLWACTSAGAAGNEVVGAYWFAGVTDQGTQVCVTLHLRLVNNDSRELTISGYALRGLLPRGRQAPVTAAAHLLPREAAEFTQQFTVPRAEYERWRKGARPLLQVTLQSEEGREVTRTVELVPRPAMGGK